MPTVFPFHAVQFSGRDLPASAAGVRDISNFVAPPYDVLDAAGKAALLRRSPKNIVGIDLPHIPPKELGPPQAYDAAASTFRAWLADGTLARLDRPAMFVYRETFHFAGARHQRTGMACAIETLPFGPRPGGGVLPHEETFSGPKEDRFALMKASQAQFSPIFGLHQDEHGKATSLLTSVMNSRSPDTVANTNEGFGGELLHEVWTVQDQPTLSAYADALRGEDIFVADGHHRYNTALNYLKHLESQGPVAADHPARRCMYVLVGMSDPGMVIGPTHRVLGGMSSYSFDAFRTAAQSALHIVEHPGTLHDLEAAMDRAAPRSGLHGPPGPPGPPTANVFGLYDFASKKAYIATLARPDPLGSRFASNVREWRDLDVAIVQYLIVEEICQPALNASRPVHWAFPHSIQEVIDIGAGKEMGSGGGKSFVPQLGVIVRPTPLEAVRAISRAGELMPQKSTFFYPKLATGLFINPLR